MNFALSLDADNNDISRCTDAIEDSLSSAGSAEIPEPSASPPQKELPFTKEEGAKAFGDFRAEWNRRLSEERRSRRRVG